MAETFRSNKEGSPVEQPPKLYIPESYGEPKKGPVNPAEKQREYDALKEEERRKAEEKKEEESSPEKDGKSIIQKFEEDTRDISGRAENARGEQLQKYFEDLKSRVPSAEEEKNEKTIKAEITKIKRKIKKADIQTELDQDLPGHVGLGSPEKQKLDSELAQKQGELENAKLTRIEGFNKKREAEILANRQRLLVENAKKDLSEMVQNIESLDYKKAKEVLTVVTGKNPEPEVRERALQKGNEAGNKHWKNPAEFREQMTGRIRERVRQRDWLNSLNATQRWEALSPEEKIKYATPDIDGRSQQARFEAELFKQSESARQEAEQQIGSRLSRDLFYKLKADGFNVEAIKRSGNWFTRTFGVGKEGFALTNKEGKKEVLTYEEISRMESELATSIDKRTEEVIGGKDGKGGLIGKGQRNWKNRKQNQMGEMIKEVAATPQKQEKVQENPKKSEKNPTKRELQELIGKLLGKTVKKKKTAKKGK
ncbi:MAG: hypothetical protein Q8Q48_04020 [Candidatus Staskawiczbacteria bacterium]|nr:hypothetical protein [Candidatus Staskawiczbacteria bacterium]